MGNEQRKSYYERHKVELCKKTLDQYMPQSIKEINARIPEKINIYYKDFPYEIYAEPVIKKRMHYWKIRENCLEYQECYSAAMQGYLYSIHRCALCNYTYAEFYIRKMINIAIICALVATSEEKKMIRLDDEKNGRRY